MRSETEQKKQGESFLKLVGVKEFYNITRAKIISAVNCGIVLFVCATATFAVDTALNTKTVNAQPVETSATVSLLTDQSEETVKDNIATSESTSVSTTASTSASSSQTSATTSATETEVTTESTTESTTEATEEIITEGTTTTTVEETTVETTVEETTTAETTVETTTAATTTTAETTSSVSEKELYLTVYATTTINVRSGPGTDFNVVKKAYAGDEIDVVAVTSNGWYKTYNGNYVSKDYTTETKPTPIPTPRPTQKQADNDTNSTTVEAQVTTPSGEGYTCKITFYGPVLMSDGTYSKTTATGTTCTQGRTCGADWSVFPAGTVLYIENDPLGGDGYYTVEDTGPGAKGYSIDIYADDGETGNYSTCTRTVHVV